MGSWFSLEGARNSCGDVGGRFPPTSSSGLVGAGGCVPAVNADGIRCRGGTERRQ